MLTYDDLIAGLEDAWIAAGLHEHALIESVIPASHDRNVKVELFPDHPEPLTEENMPPWVELSFTWSALHQLYSEGRDFAPEPLDLIWIYNVPVRGMIDRSDNELVRMFQRVVHAAFQRFYPAEAETMEPIAVEVRRIYQDDGQRLRSVYSHLVSTNLTDLSDQWANRDLHTLHNLMRTEAQLVSTIIHGLTELFAPNGRGYRSVDTA
ncbi:MAG: hypothetical protein MI924_21265 [Chloroflexales bacterium]|nr:hypothetical protein [Chloroflexales bacterium]